MFFVRDRVRGAKMASLQSGVCGAQVLKGEAREVGACHAGQPSETAVNADASPWHG